MRLILQTSAIGVADMRTNNPRSKKPV